MMSFPVVKDGTLLFSYSRKLGVTSKTTKQDTPKYMPDCGVLRLQVRFRDDLDRI